jgi:molybdopterin converting factor small subunit
MVKLLYFGIVRQHTQCKEEFVTVSTLGEMLDFLSEKYGKTTQKAVRASMIALNGEKVETLNRKLAIPDGSVIGIHPICSGG